MARVQYALPARKLQIIRDPELTRAWMYRTVKSSPPALALEEQIYRLRLRMEQLFLQEQSLTAEQVIEASSQLDLKINEYICLTQSR
jgi:hypothetical protein